MNIKVLTVLTLLTAVLQVVWAPPVATFIDCVTATPAVPAFYYMALGPTFDTDIVAKCSQSCLQSGYQYAGISEGTYCFCSALFDPAAAVSAPLCDFLCDGLACGTEDSNVFAAYDTGGGSPAFTMVATNDPVTVQVDLTPEALGASFLVDLDVEAPPSYLTLASISTPGFLVPGLYTVKVLAMIEGTKLSSYDETNLTQEAIPVIDEVACPIVWEPNELYYCNVSVTMQNELDSYTSTFSDDLSAFSITGIGSEIYRLGTPPPRGISLEVAAPYSDIDEIRKAVPISRASQLLALDFYAYAAGDITAGIIRPTCAGGVYSVDVGGCMTLPPDDPDGLIHTCEATGTFWPQEPTCGDGAGVGMVEEAPATWAFVPGASVTMTFVEPGFYRELLAAPVDLLPGDTISATGPVGKSPVERQWGDVVDGVPTTSHHYVAAVVKEKMPIQLAHICTTINVDVTLDVVDDDATAAALANHTSCERNITDIALVISQIETDLFNTTVNYVEPYYIRSNTDADFIFVFSVAGPTTFTLAYDPPIGLNNTFVDLTDYPLGLAPHNKTEVLQMADDFVYIITVYAANQHNDLTGPVSNTAILYVQHPVLPTWTVAPNHPVGFMIPSQLGEIIFINSDTLANFPTNASAYVEWGDGITQTLPFEHSGDKQPILKHNYTNHGIYNISVYIYNVVSGYNVSCQILIVEEIINFEVYVKYFPSETSTTPRDGFGKYKNQYPLDKNLTFFPVMAQGTVSQYVAYNDTSTLEMFTFDVIDMFNPIEIPFKFHIDYETFVNMTVYAINVFQSVPVRLFIEIVGQVRNCMIDDFSDVVDQFEEKKFMVSYESVGAGTCLVIHWGDTDLSLVDTWGENITCQGKYPDATYHEDPFLDMIMNISHTFTWRSLFNVSIYAFNDLSFCSHRLMTVVTDIKCKPPIVSIIQGSISHETPLSFVKSKAANIYTLASLDCDLTSTTKKRWQLYRANGTGDLEAYIPTMDVIPSWNKAHLSIPKLHLDYNMYVAWYTITMWDDAIPPGWTFQKRTMTYFEIGQTPLIPILMENAVSKVIRGVTQDLLLQPGTLSIDPDDPDNKNFKVEWRCRKIEEAWPASDTTAKLMSPVAGGGGCFGHGPGLLDYAGTELLIAGDEFVAINQVYEFQATVSKDVRTEAVIGQVHIVDYVAPVLTMRCASPALCKPFGDGVYMNPSSRMAIIAECLEACDGPLDYDWAATDVDGNLFPQNTDYFPLGFDNNEVSFSTQFFDDNPDLTDFHLSLSGVNSFNRKGFASFFMKVNKRPENGYCQVIEPPTRLALVDTYTLVCDEWTDPEDIGVTHYVVNLINELGTRSTVLEMKHFPITPQQEPMVLPPGKLLVEVKVYDEWGAYTVVNVADLEVLMPNEDQVDQAAIEAYIAELQGAGDVQLLNMVLYAQSKVIQEAPWLSLDESLPEDELNARIIKIAEANNVALAAIKENTNYDTLASVNIAAGIMSSILDYSLQTQYTLQTIDTKAREKVLDVSEDAISSIMELDVPEPNDLVQLVTLIAGNNMAMGKNQATFGSKPEEGCFAVPSDFKDKDSFDYNSEVTGLDMVQEADPDVAAKCHITDTTRETAVKMVPDSDKVLHNVSMKMMGGYVVGETHEFQTSNGVYIKMGVVRRKDLIKLDIGITGSSVGLQNAFCPQLNCSMEMPFGFIIREWPVILHSFPKTVDKLSKGTKVIDYELYSRDLEVLVIQDLPPTQTIKVTISKTYGEDGNTTLPAMTKVNAIKASAKKTIPVMYSTFNVTTSDSAISLEILPDNVTNRLFLMIDKPRLPTLKHNMRFYFVKDLTLNDGKSKYI
ncbi:Polycystin-1-like 1 [Homarus americanus]|uniref:Polycystin-1-like 1 n=1 Tax=Homarus americanus TaxID=6706 RepID=A0A8J5JG41_HOMAM|nr:Polycystin-1-like 1 [Homarus americanus]